MNDTHGITQGQERRVVTAMDEMYRMGVRHGAIKGFTWGLVFWGVALIVAVALWRAP